VPRLSKPSSRSWIAARNGVHATVSPGALLQLPWEPSFNALVYVLTGGGRVGSHGRPVRDGQLVVLGRGDWLEIRADDQQDSRSPALEVCAGRAAHPGARHRE
jgi:redox-sensitive bicupin YhaK (pirin superfamily)